MADKPSETKTFAQFLEEQPAPAEIVTLTGHAARSAKPGSFSFTTGGRTLELPIDAVKCHKVLSEGPQRLIELEIVVGRIDAQIVKAILADGIKQPSFDHTYKEVTTDILADKHPHKDAVTDPISLVEPIFDPAFAAEPAAGAQPFVLATPHHAPASTIAAQMEAPAAAQFATVPARDLTTTVAFLDRHTFKEVVKDPILDTYTLPETIFQDPANTAAEGIGVQTGGGQVINPAVQAQAEMLRLGTTPVTDITTVAFLDQPQTIPWFDRPYTFKEVAKDPITDVYTVAEGLPGGGAGTLQEGVAGGGSVVNPVWNLPGMMF